MDKIVIALNLVIDYIETNSLLNEKDISDYLFTTGFDDHEIRQVLSVLSISETENLNSFRIFTKSEKKTFTDAALVYLQKLHFTGILDMLALEDVIEVAMDTDSIKVDVEQVKNFVLFTIIDKKSLFATQQNDDDEYLH